MFTDVGAIWRRTQCSVKMAVGHLCGQRESAYSEAEKCGFTHQLLQHLINNVRCWMMIQKLLRSATESADLCWLGKHLTTVVKIHLLLHGVWVFAIFFPNNWMFFIYCFACVWCVSERVYLCVRLSEV